MCLLSGAGIGWMGDLPLTFDNSKQQQQKHQDNIPPPLLDMIHSVQHSNHGPSHDYLQTLLHVNEELLAESLASNKSCQDETPSTLMRLAPPQQTNQLLITPPLTTIDEINNTTANTSTITNSIAQQQQVINQLSTPPITPRNE